jgi:opacity protein-like surface antigen
MRMKSLLAIAMIAALPLAAAAAKKDTPQPMAAAQPVAQKQVAVPAPEAMVIMIRSSLLALSQANQTNNYAVLSALGSDSFRSANSPARLGELFASFRSNNIDLAPVTLVNPILSQQPIIANGNLRMIGYFPTQPMQVNFDLQYEPTAAGWKLLGIAVNLNKVQQTALLSQPMTR